MIPNLKQSEVWFVTGSQHLYGPETLAQVAEQLAEDRRGARLLHAAPAAGRVQARRHDTGRDLRPAARGQRRQATASASCSGCTRSRPRRCGSAASRRCRSRSCTCTRSSTATCRGATIDMDFMNLNQAAHGDREFGFICTRLRQSRKVVVGHWQDDGGPRPRSAPGRAPPAAGPRRAAAQGRPLRRQHARGGGHRGRQGRGAAPARLLGERLRRRRPGRA